MKFLANIIWFIICGIETAILWFVPGLIWCVTIIGIPFGVQCMKLARLAVWPFGTSVQPHFFKHPIANVIWMIFGGIPLALYYLVVGLLLCITVIGIPFGLQCFKMARLSLAPFGAAVA